MTAIVSDSSEDSAKPWFEFTIMKNFRVRFDAANGLGAYDGSDVSDMAHLLGSHKLTISSAKPEEGHVLAITDDGEIDFVPRSEQRPIYYAHLAWYDPTTDEWEKLDFVEE